MISVTLLACSHGTLQGLGLLSIYFKHFISSQKEIKPAKTKESQNQFASVTKVKGSAIKTFYLQRKLIKKLEVKLKRGTYQCSMH